jgi:nitrile hydratase subunit beta
MGEVVSASAPPAFRVGDGVRVATRTPSTHVRTPWYVKGKTGTVVAYRGRWGNPEELAHGVASPSHKALFSVRFRQDDLWADYSGPAQDSVCLDLYEHWLTAEEQR